MAIFLLTRALSAPVSRFLAKGKGNSVPVREGKARAYLDPDDGQWKLDQLSLSDRGQLEILDGIRARYSEYTPSENAD